MELYTPFLIGAGALLGLQISIPIMKSLSRFLFLKRSRRSAHLNYLEGVKKASTIHTPNFPTNVSFDCSSLLWSIVHLCGFRSHSSALDTHRLNQFFFDNKFFQSLRHHPGYTLPRGAMAAKALMRTKTRRYLSTRIVMLMVMAALLMSTIIMIWCIDLPGTGLSPLTLLFNPSQDQKKACQRLHKHVEWRHGLDEDIEPGTFRPIRLTKDH